MKNNFSEEDIKDLKRVRNYFGEHDVSVFEHTAYKIIDDAIKKLTLPDINNPVVCQSCKGIGYDIPTDRVPIPCNECSGTGKL